MKGPGPTATLPLVEVQHDRVRSLFVEASRRTGTPGVVQDASSRAVAELSRHVAAESAVIDALVRTKLGADVAIVKWMVGFTLAFQVATLFFIWQLMLRLPA